MVRKIARYENSTLLLQNREYESALYNTYLLLQENPNSIYLKKCQLKSLYGLSKYASTNRFNEVHNSPDYIVGSQQQVYHLFEKMSASEITVLALNNAWQLHKFEPNDPEVKAILKDLFKELIDNYYPNRSFFSSTPRTGTVTETKVGPEGTVTKVNDSLPKPKIKFKKKRQQKTKKKKVKFNSASDMNKYAFVELMNDSDFVHMYDVEIKASKLRKKEIRKTKSYSFKRQKEKEELNNTLYGDALGIEKVVFINPVYYKINLSKKKALRLIASEAAQKRLNSKIQENASLAGLEYSIVDKKNLAELGTQGYNDNAVLNTFFDEMLDHGDIDFINYMDEDMQVLSNKYATSYFVWTGFVSVKKQNKGTLYKALAAIYFPILAPFVIYEVLTPDYDTYFYSVLIDVRTGKKLKTTFQEMDVRDRNDVLDGTLYDLYVQYKKQKPESKNEKSK